MREVVRVSKLPEKHPWIEGEDYEVLEGIVHYQRPCRIRDETGETFQLYGDMILMLDEGETPEERLAKLAKIFA